jgi:DNA-binding NarL/FixJ family response regulator
MGCVLVVSRSPGILPICKRYLMGAGFHDVEVTSFEKDALNYVINATKPRMVFVESCFYQSATPYMMGQLLREMPGLRIVAFSVGEFPDDLAMWFCFHGGKGYVNFRDGYCELKRGLRQIYEGGEYWTKAVRRRIELRKEIPAPPLGVTPRQAEVLRLLCNGYRAEEVADALRVSRRTVETHKKELYLLFHVRNEAELARAGLCLGLVQAEELCFYGTGWEARPLPDGREE